MKSTSISRNFHVFSALLAFVACASADDEGGPVEQSQQALGTTPDTWRPPPPPANPRPDPLAALEEVRSHEQEPWVQCRTTHRAVAADELGPVIAHGFLEAPGYRRGRIDAAQARFLRRASLRWLPLSRGFLYEDTSLPSANLGEAQLKRLVEGAIQVAGFEPPGELDLRNAYDTPPRAGAPVSQTQWVLGFSHDRVPIRGALCRLSAAREQEAFGSLVCWLPTGPATTYEPFIVSERDTRQIALQAARMRGARVLSKRHYELEKVPRGEQVRGLAREQVVLFDGETEMAVTLDGQGRVLEVFPTGRGFTWRGLPLDYQQGLRVQDTVYEIGAGQTEFLDSADKLNGDNCTNPAEDTGPIAGVYKSGFVVCQNKVLSDSYPGSEYLRTRPRPDNDFTNAPNAPPPTGFSPDSLGPQLLETISFGGLQIPARPSTFSGPLFNSWTGLGDPSKFKVAAAGYADLQIFHSIGVRHKNLYQNLGHLGFATLQGKTNPKFIAEQAFGPKYRFELRVHKGGIDNTAAGLSFMDVGSLSGKAEIIPPSPDLLYEVVADGSILSHEYHHHIQAEIEWEYGQALAGPGTLGDVPGVAEGMADLYGAVAVNRAKTGQLANLTDTSDPCANPDAYPSVNVNVQSAPLVRPLCNDVVFAPGAGVSQVQHVRGMALSGATFAYTKRLIASGLGEAASLVDVYEGEFVYWATLGKTSPDVVTSPGDMRRVMEGMAIGLRFKDPLSPFRPSAPGGEVAGVAPAGRRNAIRTSFGAKKMNFNEGGSFVCDLSCSAQATEALALQMLAMVGPARIESNQEATPPTFDLLTPTGTAYELFTGNTNLLHLEFSTSSAYTSPVVLDVPVSPPSNKSPNGSFRYTLPGATWAQLRDAAQSTSENRLYYRVRLCNAAGSKCWYSVQGGASFATFLQLGSGVGDSGCSCQLPGTPSGTSLPQALVSLALLGLVVARRRKG